MKDYSWKTVEEEPIKKESLVFVHNDNKSGESDLYFGYYDGVYKTLDGVPIPTYAIHGWKYCKEML